MPPILAPWTSKLCDPPTPPRLEQITVRAVTSAQPLTDRMNGCFSANKMLAHTAEPMGRVAPTATQPKVSYLALPRRKRREKLPNDIASARCRYRPTSMRSRPGCHGMTCGKCLSPWIRGGARPVRLGAEH